MRKLIIGIFLLLLSFHINGQQYSTYAMEFNHEIMIQISGYGGPPDEIRNFGTRIRREGITSPIEVIDNGTGHLDFNSSSDTITYEVYEIIGEDSGGENFLVFENYCFFNTGPNACNTPRFRRTLDISLYEMAEYGNKNSTNVDRVDYNSIRSYFKIWLLPFVSRPGENGTSSTRSLTQKLFEMPGQDVEDGYWEYSIAGAPFQELTNATHRSRFPLDLTVEEFDNIIPETISFGDNVTLRFMLYGTGSSEFYRVGTATFLPPGNTVIREKTEVFDTYIFNISTIQSPELTQNPTPFPTECPDSNDGWFRLIFEEDVDNVSSISANLEVLDQVGDWIQEETRQINPGDINAAREYDWLSLSGNGEGELPAGQYRIQYQAFFSNGTQTGTPSVYYNFEITSPAELTFNTSKNNISCVSGQGTSNDGSITISGVNGGTPPYRYSIDNGINYTSFGGNTITLSNLSAGDYTIRVIDTNGCEGTTNGNISITETINPATAITIESTPSPVTNVTVFGGTNGSISPSVSGGTTPPLTYSWSGPNGFSSNQQNISGLRAGTYTLTVTDNPEGCSTSRSFTITQPDQLQFNYPTELSDLITDVNCNGANNGAISITASGGLPDYRFELLKDNGSGTFTTTGDQLDTSNLTTATFSVTGLSGGDYKVRLTDNRNNSNPDVVIESEVLKVNEPDPIEFTFTNTSNVLCKGDATGTATVSVTGGSGSYNFIWRKDGAIYTTVQNPTNLEEGTYILTVTDDSVMGCNDITPVLDSNIYIGEPTTEVSINTVNVVSPTSGNTDGSISVQGQGGTGGGYTYLWNTGATTATISNLADGNYSVTVRDANGCPAVENYTLNELDVTITITPGEEVFCDTDTAGFTANPTGGDNNYAYNWYNQNDLTNSIGTNQTISGLTDGNYVVTVTDDLGAGTSVTSAAVNVDIPDPVIITSVNPTSVNCFGGNDGTLTINATGGTGALEYSIDNGVSYQTNNTNTFSFTGLPAGTYDIIVKDINDCQSSVFTETVPGPTNPISIPGTETDVTIFGQNTGAITINPTGGNSGYTYSWVGPNGFSSSDKDLSNLFAGTYTVTVRDNRFGSTSDNSGCEAIRAFTVTEPDELLVTIAYETLNTNLKCNGDDNARLFATVSGGETPYTYNWFKETSVGSGIFDPLADTTALLIGVDEGNYRVEISDPNGAMTFDEFYVGEPNPLAISVAETEIKCFGDATGAIDITVSGGTTPYRYLWSNGETTEDISGLLTGDYSVVVTDANDCFLSSNSINIPQPAAPLEITNETVSELSGFQTGDGSIDITVSGGESPYRYEWRIQGNTTVIGNTSRIENLASETYEVTIMDDNDCILIKDYFVDEPDLLEITNIQLDNPLQCFGDTSVSLTATVAGGVTPYNYRWYNTLDPTNDLSTTNTIANLGEGTYIVEIVDANGNRTSETTIIVNPPLLEASYTPENVSCNGGNDASIDVMVTGGTGAYSFFWSNGANTEDISGLSIGTYDLTIRDANLCETTLSITITEPPVGLNITDFTITGASGNGLSNGSIEVLANGGTPAYTYNWTDTTNTSIGTNSNILNNVAAGSYFLTLTDANNCMLGPIEYVVGEPDPLLVTPDETAIACFGENGELFAIVTGGVTPYSYQWFDSADNLISTASNTGSIPTGQYRVIVTDANLNQTEVPNINLTQPDVLEITNIAVTDVSCYNGSDGSIEITVAGGTGAYSYRWNTLGSSTNILNGIPEGAYEVTVTDENTCSVDSRIINVGQPVVYEIVNTAIIRPSGMGTNDGSISITITGGVAPFTYQWTDNTGAIVQLESNTNAISSTLSNQSEGVYNILVTDNDGCTIAETYNLANPGELLVEITQIQAISCFGGSDGILEVITTGGIGGNTYQWFNASNNTEIGNNNILNGIPAGSYYIIVSNAEGVSEQSAVFNVSEPLPVTGNLIGDAPDCFGGSDGSITITASGGNNSYSYRYRLINGVYSDWISFDNGTSTQIENLVDGTYQVQLQDGNGCFYEDNGTIGTLSIVINQPEELLISNVVPNNPTGFGLTNGSITTTIIGGTPPYTFEWSDANGVLTETSNTITNIGAGTYTITITDSLGCQTSETYILTQPDELLVTVEIVNIVLCKGDNGASLRAVPTGGIGPYNYQWFENGNSNIVGTDQLLSDIPAGSYYVIITDSQSNMVQSDDVLVSEPDELTLSLSADFILCGDGFDWTIESTVIGGTAPYTYFWTNVNQNTPNITDVLPGTYILIVRDSQGCSTQENITLVPPEMLNTTFTSTNPTCFEGNDGTINITPNGGTPPYTYFWDNGSNTEDLTGLSAGLYSVEIFDSKGCSIIQDFELMDPEELIIDLGPDKTLCIGQSYTIDAVILDSGATYSWTGDNGFTANSSEVTLSESGTYMVSVTTSLGCVSTDTIEIIALEDEISAEFLVSTDLFVNESFIIVDVSNPIPDTLEWILPETAEQIDITDQYAEIMFTEEGEYDIILKTTIGDCETFFTKTVVVRESVFDRDSENQDGLQQYVMYPNPTRGNFTIELSFDKETPIAIKLFGIANNNLIYEHTDEQQTAYSIPFNLEGAIPSGIYFVLLETPEKSYIRKIVVE